MPRTSHAPETADAPEIAAAQEFPGVLVVGTGLIGTSIALALTRAGWPVQLADADPVALAHAGARLAEAGGPGKPPAEPDIVVVAVPPAAVAPVALAMLAEHPAATVTDVASVKAGPIAAIAASHGDLTRFVGGHPMAGREISGPSGAREDLVADRLWVLTPDETTADVHIDRVRALVRACGAVPMVLAPRTHDEAVALTSHTPQVLASLLAARLADVEPGHVAVSGQGLRDVTRIAASDPALWTEILGANAGPVSEVLMRVADDLAGVVSALQALVQDSDPVARERITAMLTRGNLGRARVPDKHGGDPRRDEVTVAVLVADRPGELGRLFSTAGVAGVNLEEVHMEHAVGRPMGVVELVVDRAAEAGLLAAVRAGGWSIRS